PGQGSQYSGMTGDLAKNFDAARAVWDETASPASKIHQKVFARPAFDDETRAAQLQELTQTENAQPAIGTASLAHLALLTELGITPASVAGHSFGEVSALHAAGVLSQQDALHVARTRGQLMAEAAATTAGAMSALELPADQVRALLAELPADISTKVVVANDNSPRQVVISGETAAIEAAEKHFESRGITARRLPVSTAFHSSVVAASAEPFARALQDITFQNAQVPVFAN